jgi:TolA-binding protein
MKLSGYLYLTICVLLGVKLSIAMCKPAGAGVRNDNSAELLDVSIEDYEEKLEYERKILGGLINLLELKEREIISDEIAASELVAKNENLSISKETSEHGTVLYTIKANMVSIDEILHALVSTSGRELVLDKDIDKKVIFSVISVFLERTPLVDIIDVMVGARGLESIISDDIIFITMPAKLNLVSPFDYYQEKAIHAYQKAMIKYPDYKGIGRAYYELANFYFTSGFPTIALQEYKIVVEKYSDLPMAGASMFHIGKCYEMLGDVEKAMQSYSNYAEKYPQDSNVVDAYLVMGDIWRKQKDYEKAIEIYRYIIEKYLEVNTVSLAQMQLGYTHLELKDYDSALSTFEDMKKKQLSDEFRCEIEYQIGNCYYLMGKYDEAINILSDFVLHEQESDMQDDAYYKLSDCFFKRGDYLRAFQLYRNALTDFPDSNLSSYGFLYSGKSLRMMNMLESAKNILRKGLSIYPDSVHAESMKVEMGLCYFKDESFDLAFKVFEEIDTMNNNNIVAYQANMYAGICLCRERQHEKAIGFYIKALNGDVTAQERNQIFKLIGDCYTDLGEQTKAIMAYQGEIL